MAGNPVPDRPSDTSNPRRDRTIIPYTDADTEALVDELVDTLIILRCPLALGDAGATVSVLASLEAEIAFRLPDTVADARDHGYTWDDIATRLATTASAARHRYAAYLRSRRELPRAPRQLRHVGYTCIRRRARHRQAPNPFVTTLKQHHKPPGPTQPC